MRPPSPSKHLHDILQTNLHPPAFLRRINLRALNNNSMRGQINAPRQRSRADQNIQMPISKQLFHQIPIRPAQARVMNANPITKQLFEIFVVDGLLLADGLEDFFGLGVGTQDFGQLVAGEGRLF